MVPSKKYKKKVRGTSSAFLPSPIINAEFWNLEFSAFELNRHVMVTDSSEDHDTSTALARVIMLPNDIAILSEENSKTIRGLLVMKQVHIDPGTFQIAYLILSIFCVFPL